MALDLRPTRRRFLQLAGLGAAAMLSPQGRARQTPSRMNILLLYVDDLRPQLGCYGVDWMHTPNIDRLAAGGVLFEKAYSQYPICGPSRASLLSGLRPTATRFRKWDARVDEDVPDTLTLPEHFRRNGYATQSLGKVFHHLDDSEQAAWSEGSWIPPLVYGAQPGSYADPANRAIAETGARGPAWEMASVPDDAYADAQIATAACDALANLSAGGKPFFLAAGFLRPHLPFNVPDRYWALYDRAKLPSAPHPHAPGGVPAEAMHNWEELRNYGGMPKEGPLDEETARTLVHGYCAGVSYMDAQIGRVLDEVDRLGLRENTLIAFVADHGWQLGDHGMWCKHCLFETSLHCPLILSGPDLPGGTRVAGLMEYLDVYPTLCEAAGLPVPAHAQGRSLRPLLRQPGGAGHDAVFSRVYHGDTIKTATHRYAEWRDESGAVTSRMLYDHRRDPGENRNIAELPEAADTVAHLSARLAQHIASS